MKTRTRMFNVVIVSVVCFILGGIVGEVMQARRTTAIEAISQEGLPLDLPELTQVYKEYQRELQTQGFYHGRIDGMWGPASKLAYDKWSKWYTTQICLELTGDYYEQYNSCSNDK